MPARSIQRAFADVAAVSMATATDLMPDKAEHLPDDMAVLYEDLGVAVVNAAPDKTEALVMAAADYGERAVQVIEPERVVYAAGLGAAVEPPGGQGPPVDASTAAYLRGYRDAVASIVAGVLGDAGAAAAGASEAWTEDALTWGLQAMGVGRGIRTGQGVRVAVLDTGLDASHPDLGSRATRASFVVGESADDGNGHGTHTAGTACGPERPAEGPRYGIAYDAKIFAGKVLNNAGKGTDSTMLDGITWAIQQGCRIISMSISGRSPRGSGYSKVFDAAIKRVLTAGTVVVAAAGNDSLRSRGVVMPVGHPANCPSVLSIGALASSLTVANFSNRGIDLEGGQVDFAGPGAGVRSAWPLATGRYHVADGTSMATPHVAGVLALIAEGAPAATAGDLIATLGRSALRLPLPSVDVGGGLPQAV